VLTWLWGNEEKGCFCRHITYSGCGIIIIIIITDAHGELFVVEMPIRKKHTFYGTQKKSFASLPLFHYAGSSLTYLHLQA
jgi:hypothetical protein